MNDKGRYRQDRPIANSQVPDFCPASFGVRLARECPLIAFLRGFGVDEVRDFPDARFSGLIQRTIDVPDIVHESGKVDFVDEPGSQ